MNNPIADYPYRVTIMTKRGAERWDRFAYHVPDDCGIGWKPYIIRVTKAAVAQTAFHSIADFRKWLRGRTLEGSRNKYRKEWPIALWTGVVKEVSP